MIRSPVLIIGRPHVGTILLFNLLSKAPELWSVGFESGAIILQWHYPRNKGCSSGALDAGDLTAESRAGILAALEAQAAACRVPHLTVRYEDLTQRPGPLLREVAEFISIDYAPSLARYAGHLPQINVVSAPDQEKWRRQNPEAIERILPIMRPLFSLSNSGFGKWELQDAALNQ